MLWAYTKFWNVQNVQFWDTFWNIRVQAWEIMKYINLRFKMADCSVTSDLTQSSILELLSLYCPVLSCTVFSVCQSFACHMAWPHPRLGSWAALLGRFLGSTLNSTPGQHLEQHSWGALWTALLGSTLDSTFWAALFFSLALSTGWAELTLLKTQLCL